MGGSRWRPRAEAVECAQFMKGQEAGGGTVDAGKEDRGELISGEDAVFPYGVEDLGISWGEAFGEVGDESLCESGALMPGGKQSAGCVRSGHRVLSSWA